MYGVPVTGKQGGGAAGLFVHGQVIISHFTCRGCRLNVERGVFRFAFPLVAAGHLHQAKVWLDEESLWTECAVWMWDRCDHLQRQPETIPIRKLRHGSHLAEVHGLQWTTWKPDQCGYCWCKHGQWTYFYSQALFCPKISELEKVIHCTMHFYSQQSCPIAGKPDYLGKGGGGGGRKFNI